MNFVSYSQDPKFMHKIFALCTHGWKILYKFFQKHWSLACRPNVVVNSVVYYYCVNYEFLWNRRYLPVHLNWWKHRLYRPYIDLYYLGCVGFSWAAKNIGRKERETVMCNHPKETIDKNLQNNVIVLDFSDLSIFELWPYMRHLSVIKLKCRQRM